MAGIGLGCDDDGSAGQGGSIPRRKAPPVRGPRRQKWQARAKDRRLHLVEARVHAGFYVVAAIVLPAVTEPAQALGQRLVIGDNRAAARLMRASARSSR